MRDASPPISEAFEPVDQAAHRLGVPVAWLKREVEERRVPSLTAGRRTLLNVEQVRAALNVRAAQSVGGGAMIGVYSEADLRSLITTVASEVAAQLTSAAQRQPFAATTRS